MVDSWCSRWPRPQKRLGALPLWEKPGIGGPSHLCYLPGIQVGYMDDPRNTDNAWIETVAVSIHFPGPK